MNIPIIAGRGLSEQDAANRPRVLLINQTLARREFLRENPIGASVYVGSDPVPWKVVGVVGDVRQFGLDREPEPQFFADARQWSGGMPIFPIGAYFGVRLLGNPAPVITSIQAIVRELDPQALAFNVASMDDLVATTIARPRMYTVLLGIFAGVSLMLAAIGIYGVMAYSVTQRTREIGIRMALGAQKSEVMALVLRHSLMLTAVGIVIGLVGAAAVTQYLDGMLFGVQPLDLTTFVAVSIVFAATATLAAFLPARRATRVDPLVALRYE
jgi:putative ABC transport system permease protein